MKHLLWLLIVLIVAGCGPKPGEEPPADKPAPKPIAKTPVKPYVPKPGESVIKLSFVTEADANQGNGDVYIKLFTEDAPKTSGHILDLVKKGFYKDTLVHRVELGSDFKLTQFGNAGTKGGDLKAADPGSGSTVPLEVNKHKHLRGAVGMARTNDPNTGDSQMYICFVDIPNLDSGYTVFGEVVQGLDVAEGLGLGSKITDCAVVQDARKKK